MWPTHDPDFKQGMNDRGFTQWMRKGLSTLFLLVKNQEFIDVKTISDRTELARQDFYRYLQLQDYFVKDIVGLIQENK